MSKIRHWKYIHPQIALPKLKKIRRISGWVKFDEKYPYDTGKNQMDWNKLLGIKISLFGQHKESIMLGHRWNPEIKKAQLIPYTHLTGNNDFDAFNEQLGLERVGTKNAWILPELERDFELNQECHFDFGLSEGVESYFAQIGDSPYETFDHDIGFYDGYKINGWMGGQRAAQKCFSIETKLTYE